MNRKWLFITASICLVLVLLIPVFSPVSATNQGSIVVSNPAIILNFPRSMSFTAQIKSNVNITDIRLRFRVDQLSYAEVFSEGFVDFIASPSVNASYDLDLRRFGGFPPGTTIYYWWAVKDANQSFLESSPVTYQIQDNRFNWKSMVKGNIKLYWYQGDNAFAQTLMDTAQSALVKLTKDTGAVPEKTISIFIYGNAQDLQSSMIYPSEWTGGVSFTTYNIITIGISSSNLNWGKTAMVHELTHNVIGQVVYNPYSDLPVWFNEGLAMFNQGPLTAQFTTPLVNACRNNQLLSVRMISSPFSAFTEKANLSYAQSYTLVEFLIQKYGSEKINELLKNFKQGNTYDGAFKQVLGIDLDGLNAQWQPWVKNTYAR